MSQKTDFRPPFKTPSLGGTYFKESIDAKPVLVQNTGRTPEDPNALKRSRQTVEEAPEPETELTKKTRGKSGD